MTRPIISIALTTHIISCLLVSGCEFDFNVSNNSSQGENDYFEEPLSDTSIEYEAALDISNTFVQLVSEGAFGDAHNLFDDELKENVSIEDLRGMRKSIDGAFGPFVEFKTMQWAFESGSENGEDFVYSTKIVVHQKTDAFYIIGFVDDGRYEKIAGISVRQRDGDERVAQAL